MTSPPPIHRAFTLIELMIVVVIIGIIGLLVIPAVGTSLHAGRLSVAANILAADIDYAQSQSINAPESNYPQAYLIQFDVTDNLYYLARSAAPTTAIPYPADTDPSRPYLNDFSTGRNANLTGVQIVSVTPSTGTIAFDAYGKPNLTSDALITLSYSGQTLTVRINAATGDVTIQ